jgi:regulatory protein
MKITAIKQQVKRPGRYSIYVDDKFAFGLSESALIAQRLASGQEIDAEQFASLKDAAGTDKAYGNALRYVVMRPRSMWEMRTYLQRKKVEEPIADSIIERLLGLGLLGDEKFAEAWVSNRRILKATSKRRLRLELQQKHVASSVIDKVLQEDEADERSVLAELVAKKQARYPDRNKFMQYLARQGFGYDDIKSVLDQPQEE